MREDALFPFHMRIPSWCSRAIVKVNGKMYMEPAGGQVVKLHREWKDGDVVELDLPMTVTTSRWHDQSVGVERGPLVYALKIKEDWKNVPASDRYGAYREVRPASAWNYGLLETVVRNTAEEFEVVEKKAAGSTPWTLENAPIEIRTKGKRIPEWKLYNETAGPVPYSPLRYLKEQKAEELVLIPYGCTTLRISQFPLVQ